MIGNISNLAKMIEESAVPAWLYNYVEEHLNEIIFDLNVIGTHEIPMPDGRMRMLSKGQKIEFQIEIRNC